MTVDLVLLSGVSYRGTEIAGSRVRDVLALLAAHPRADCSTTRLAGALWPDEQPERPAKAVQVLVSRARARLGAESIATTPTGYRLTLDDRQVDTSAVLLHAAAGEQRARDGDHAAALAQAEAGLALCTGAQSWDSGFTDGPLSQLRAARLPTYRSLLRVHALALSRLGRRTEAMGPLGELVQRHPRDEEVLAELLRCEAAIMGSATALARYDAYQRALREDLGSDPGAALRTLHLELLRSELPTVRRGVQYEPNLLLGRADDVAKVTELLRASRVTSIVGAGGLGKTRLAHVVSRAAEQRTVHFVALAGVTTDADVAGEVASVLGVGEPRPTSSVGRLAAPKNAVDGIVDALGPGPALLVLDNCEHVVRGAAELVQALVSASGDLRVLTTSRAPLVISSEAVYPLPELSMATSIELFEQRARAARPGVELPPEAVRELCVHLDGLPLAVELAAARVRVMSVGEIARHINDRFALLRGGTRDTPPRHRTLHAVIDWSWQLLEPAARAAMRALSIFPGGFSAEAARRLVDGAEDILLVLQQLVDQSLLKVADTGLGTRFRMLETVREFSAARRAEAAETTAVTERFLAWARDFGVARHESVFSADLVSFVEDTRAEQDNLMQALRYGLDREDGATVAATSAVLGGLWIVESNFTRSTSLTGETGWVLSHYRPERAFVEAARTALVLCTVSAFLIQRTRPVRLLATLRRFPSAPPDSLTRAAQIVLCSLTEGLGSLFALCNHEEPLVAGMADYVASHVLEAGNDLDGALSAARRMLAVVEDCGTLWIQAVAHSRVGELCLQAEPGDTALRHLSVATAALEKLGAWTSVARARWAIVLAHLQRGALDETERALAEATRFGDDDGAGLPMFEVAVRAEIHLARGEIDAGLHEWRIAAHRLRAGESTLLGQWPLEVQSVCVVAHAHHGRTDLVADITALLRPVLSSMITAAQPAEFPVCGAALLALALADPGPADDPRATRLKARMIALAERLRYPRNFQPTMTVARIRRLAERSAYAHAVSSYTDLDHAGLRTEVLAALSEHDQLTGSGRA